jgi:hypothetical protein
LDGAKVEEEDLGTGFFLRDEDIGKNVSVSEDCRWWSLV